MDTCAVIGCHETPRYIHIMEFPEGEKIRWLGCEKHVKLHEKYPDVSHTSELLD